MTERSPRPEWTFRRVPGRIALGGGVAASVAVLLTILHVGGWDTRIPGWPLTWLPVFLIGFFVALLFLVIVVAPILRRLAVRGRLTRARVVRVGAASYGLITLAWMVLLDVGPPSELERWAAREILGGAPWARDAVRLAYNAVVTPAAFALYGALAAWAGWRTAFGREPSFDARAWLA